MREWTLKIVTSSAFLWSYILCDFYFCSLLYNFATIYGSLSSCYLKKERKKKKRKAVGAANTPQQSLDQKKELFFF